MMCLTVMVPFVYEILNYDSRYPWKKHDRSEMHVWQVSYHDLIPLNSNVYYFNYL